MSLARVFCLLLSLQLYWLWQSLYTMYTRIITVRKM